MKRKRNHIPLIERLAAALALVLPPEQRDDLRRRKPPPPAKEVVSLFDFDHVVLHALGGEDHWSNLTPMLRPEHREKSRRDTSSVAKVKRLDAQWSGFTAAMAKGRKPPKKKSAWPKRKFRRA